MWFFGDNQSIVARCCSYTMLCIVLPFTVMVDIAAYSMEFILYLALGPIGFDLWVYQAFASAFAAICSISYMVWVSANKAGECGALANKSTGTLHGNVVLHMNVELQDSWFSAAFVFIQCVVLMLCATLVAVKAITSFMTSVPTLTAMMFLAVSLFSSSQ
eukprot:TRINITY_DN51720_c0_g1_i1.p1 TRINITY_DN51720_c0_g1~~TRINITY_DN51720_c0_g1_i1.p1  ORF type:complete len:160 (-),score=3.04 TRINITY_DN51720_c0_g1_i1:48-527(-)